MNKESKSSYKKAVEYYEKGLLGESLKFCERALSEDLRNASALNLKGLILYVKGELEGAISTWNINRDYNDNDISKNYIKDSIEDFNRLEIYKKGIVLLENGNLNDAIEAFTSCKESDFNAINVDYALAKSYLLLNDFGKSSFYIIKSLERNKENTKGIKLAKIIENKSGEKLSIKYKKNNNYIILVLAILIIMGIFILKLLSKDAEVPIVKEEESPIVENTTDLSNVEKYIDNEDFVAISTILEEYEVDKLDERNKQYYILGETTLENKGSEYYYNRGMEQYKDKNYEVSKIFLNLSYKYDQQSYLFPHILFFNWATLNKLGEVDGGVKYLEELIEKYPDTEYTEETLYNLAIYYKNINEEKSEGFSLMLKNKYPKSIYYNSNIKEILKDN